MFLKKQIFILCFLLTCSIFVNAQIEVAHVSLKNFKATGFGGFLNFSLPVSEANYLTVEGGLQYFKNKKEEDLALAPVLLGYRYTLNQSGTGFYVEPNAGYCFGASGIPKYNDETGTGGYEKVAGPMAGVGVGYLLEPGEKLQFNVGLRYERTFAEAGANVFSFRISHAFTFGRREE